jgi:hypothetical protein
LLLSPQGESKYESGRRFHFHPLNVEALEIFNKAREPGFHKMRLIDRLYEEFSQTNSENYKNYGKYPTYPKWSKDFNEYQSIVFGKVKEKIELTMLIKKTVREVTDEELMQIITALVREETQNDEKVEKSQQDNIWV